MKITLTFSTATTPVAITWQVLETPSAQQWVELLRGASQDEQELLMDRTLCVNEDHASALLDQIQIFGVRFMAGQYGRATIHNVTDTILMSAFNAATGAIQHSKPEDLEYLQGIIAACKDLRYWISKRTLRSQGIPAYGHLRFRTATAMVKPITDVAELGLTSDIRLGGLYAGLEYDKTTWHNLEHLAEIRGTTQTYEHLLEHGIGGPTRLTSNFHVLYEPDIIGLDSKILMAGEVFPTEMLKLGYPSAAPALLEAGKLQVAELLTPFGPVVLSSIQKLINIFVEE